MKSPEPAGGRSAFRNVFERFLVHPTKARKAYEVTPYARLSARKCLQNRGIALCRFRPLKEFPPDINMLGPG